MSRATILLVEDDPLTRKFVCFTLERAGYTVLQADTGAVALSLFLSERPDLVLQDIVLPDIDGFDLVQRLRALPRGEAVRMLAFSAHLSKLEAARDASIGFDDVVAKPIAPSRLVAVIDACFGTTRDSERFGGGRRLVVAEENPIQLKLTTLQLERLGFLVEPTSNGEQALAAARRAPPACIIADASMPRLNGFGLALAVRQDASIATVPVLLLTSGELSFGDRDLARRVGANRLIPRTPEQPELLQVLRGILSVK